MQTFTFGNLEISGFPRREAEAVFHTAMGRNTKEAAKAMGTSPWTVEDQLKSAMARLDARNRVHLVSEAFVRGLLKPRVAKLVLALLLVGTAPVIDMGAEDWSRYSVRNVKIRRGRDDDLPLALPA